MLVGGFGVMWDFYPNEDVSRVGEYVCVCVRVRVCVGVGVDVSVLRGACIH